MPQVPHRLCFCLRPVHLAARGALLVSMLFVASCTASPMAPPQALDRGLLTALERAVERLRLDEAYSLDKDESIDVMANDKIAIDEQGRALVRFQDDLAVELFRNTAVEIAEVRRQPAGFPLIWLTQIAGHSRTRFDSAVHQRIVLATSYATIRPTSASAEFAVCHAEGILTCMVAIEGEVEVEGQGQVVALKGGESTYILAGQPPKPPICADLEQVRKWLDSLRSRSDVGDLGRVVTGWKQQPCSQQRDTTESEAARSTATIPSELASPVSDETVWVNPIDEAIYGRVPAGEFSMGSDDGDISEMPVHPVYLDEFWIMQTEVKNAQYAQCVEAGACSPPSNERWAVPAFADHPVTGVNWSQANTYAVWVGGRLPTEAEWEKAARGVDGRVYPWGDEKPDRQRTNFNAIVGFTMPVGSYLQGASPYGMLDMAGNVEEWVTDWYDKDYYTMSPDRNPQGPATGTLRILRGGSFRQNLYDIRSSARVDVSPESNFDTVGFRIVVSAPSD